MEKEEVIRRIRELEESYNYWVEVFRRSTDQGEKEKAREQYKEAIEENIRLQHENNLSIPPRYSSSDRAAMEIDKENETLSLSETQLVEHRISEDFDKEKKTVEGNKEDEVPLEYPFKIKNLVKPTFFQKIFHRQPKINALIELNNFLATKKNSQEITPEYFEDIEARYRVNIYKRFKKEFEDIYRSLLSFYLTDFRLSEEEAADLSHLKFLLDLGNEAAESINSAVIQEIYKSKVDTALKDGKIDAAEKEQLQKVRESLKLPEESANNIYKGAAENLLQGFLTSCISDQRLSPSEEADLMAISNNLGVHIEFEEKTKALLDKYRLYWLIENGNIPAINADINLQKGEQCFFCTNAKWLENRTVTRRFQYGGLTARIKIYKGLYYRMGDLGVNRVSQDVVTHIDSGNIYLTNKRIIFVGNKRNLSLNLTRILNFKPYKNGVDIQKDSGRNPFFEFSYNVDVFVMMLSRVLKDITL